MCPSPLSLTGVLWIIQGAPLERVAHVSKAWMRHIKSALSVREYFPLLVLWGDICYQTCSQLVAGDWNVIEETPWECIKDVGGNGLKSSATHARITFSLFTSLMQSPVTTAEISRHQKRGYFRDWNDRPSQRSSCGKSHNQCNTISDHYFFSWHFPLT